MVDAVCTENQKAWEKVTSPHSSEQMHSAGMVMYCSFTNDHARWGMFCSLCPCLAPGIHELLEHRRPQIEHNHVCHK
eukprot:1159529-Pelagomonas_calceolata.AAC.2